MSSPKVAIIHPWMPQYRTEFFARLDSMLEAQNIDLHVFHGQTPPEWAARNDTDANSISTQLPTRFISIVGRNIALKSTTQVLNHAPYDVIIYEQAVRNLETYRLLLRGTRTARQHAYWGHGRTYTEARSSGQEHLKLWLTKRADWFFGYTAAGVEHLVENGFPRERTTVVHNSMDSENFSRELSGTPDDYIREFCIEHDLRGHTALYIGGLDKAKRLDFLIAAADIIHSMNPEFRLLVVGAGSQQEWLFEEAASRPWVKMLGPSTGEVKCAAFRSAQVLAVPGRVGLVAVDSLASGVPIVTTDWPLHAPEFEYLDPGRTCQVSENSVGAYAEMLGTTIFDSVLLERMRAECLRDAPEHTIAKMASNFSRGVSAILQTDRSA